MKKRILFVFACICILSLSGCSSFNRKIPDDDSMPALRIAEPSLIAQLMTSLQHSNENLRSYKGIGRVKFSRYDAIQSARVVFAGDNTSKLRFELLGIYGQPMTSIAYDGSWLYLAQHSENLFHKQRNSKGDLSLLITIPVKLDELNALLAGHVPMIKSDSVRLYKTPENKGFRLVLKTGWLKHRQEHIYLLPDMKTVWKYEMFERPNVLLYEAEIMSYQTYEGYRIPQTIEFMDKDGNSLLLKVERYWPNAEIDPSMFVLKKVMDD
jgi:hypothetical protein